MGVHRSSSPHEVSRLKHGVAAASSATPPLSARTTGNDQGLSLCSIRLRVAIPSTTCCISCHVTGVTHITHTSSFWYCRHRIVLVWPFCLPALQSVNSSWCGVNVPKDILTSIGVPGAAWGSGCPTIEWGSLPLAACVVAHCTFT